VIPREGVEILGDPNHVTTTCAPCFRVIPREGVEILGDLIEGSQTKEKFVIPREGVEIAS
jgi:hypothetical protein